MDLPPSWEIRFSSKRKRPYYFNTQTLQSQWDPPSSLDSSSSTTTTTSTPRIRVSHLLVKHRESRRPSSWRCATITCTKSEAWTQIQTYRTHLLHSFQSGKSPTSLTMGTASFFSPTTLLPYLQEFIQHRSDCSSAVPPRCGDLGYLKLGQFQLPFEKMALQLKVGEMSEVIETESGFHLIFRTE
ncbi:hypothetical protein HMI54_009861 [Coelomomyces lativittatus]|nr:hypothetical protein HMI55_001512 [Coelomomyces lativittatus]KAJ1515167.1 hypothetical protein HMI56_006405 [Coelomomyces lativittatus]KAJ1516324.1 hypothetical protein HMI54_009861 [Coelomomyces lativittatus]